jgi:hypothetical protein
LQSANAKNVSFEFVPKKFHRRENFDCLLVLHACWDFFETAIFFSLGFSTDSSSTKKPSLGSGNYKFGPSGPGSQQGSHLSPSIGPAGANIKRPPSGVAYPPPKKQKTGVLRDVSLAEAGKFGSLNEYAFFDKVRKALRNPEVYDNFLRCLVLFNQEVISRLELIQLTTPFLSRHAELFKWFKDFVGYRDGGNNHCFSSGADHDSHRDETAGLDDDRNRSESERGARERITGDSAMEIGMLNIFR